MFRKVVAFIAAVALILIAGCAGKPGANTDSNGKGSTASKPLVNWGTNLRNQVWVNMIDAQTGWALNGANVSHTTDGGQHWTAVTPKTDGLLIGASCATGPDGFWIGLQQQANATSIPVMQTSDGGKTWTRTDIPATATGDFPTIRQISFSDETHGWLLVNYGGVAMGSEQLSLYRTTDNGRTWQLASAADASKPSETQLPFSGVKTGVGFASPTLGWLCGRWYGDSLYLYATADGGRTWRSSGMPVPKGYETAGGSADSLPPLFIGKSGFMPAIFRSQKCLLFFATRDGGLNWQATTPIVSANDNQAFAWTFISGTRGWVTDGSRLYTTGDAAKTWQRIDPDKNMSALMQQGYLISQLQFTDASVGWALLEGGTSRPAKLLRTTDGGQTWESAGELKY